MNEARGELWKYWSASAYNVTKQENALSSALAPQLLCNITYHISL